LLVSSFFIVIGLSTSVKTGIVYQGISLMGAVSLSFGFGIFGGTYLSCFLFKSKLNL
jgi:hypothetical protein